MTVGDITTPISLLLEDALAAEKYLNEEFGSQFHRRAYIRSVFSSMEGIFWTLKQVCLNVKPVVGKRKISAQEVALLTDSSYSLKENGEIYVSPQFLKFTSNIRFTFKSINKLFKTNIEPTLNTQGWKAILEAVKIRNRIMHPKSGRDLIITDGEIIVCQEAISWLNETIASFITHITESKKTS